jgi:ubiquinone biosynthesis protein
MLKNDITGMVDLALKMTVSSEFTGTRAALERDAAGLVDANINLPLERLSIARILRELMQLLQDHGLALRPDLYLMFKALITIEQLGRDFDPQLKIVDMLKPFLLRVKIQALDPSKVLQRFINELGENISCLQDLPQTVCSVIRKVDNGELSFNVEHHRLNEIEETLYLTGERLSRSLLLTALFLGSALIIVAKIPPVWNGIPLLGMGGFCISGILSIYALWSDHRQRLKFLKERAELKLAQELRKRKY